MATESGATNSTRTVPDLSSQPQAAFMHTPLSQAQLQQQQVLQYRRQQLLMQHQIQLQLQQQQQQQQHLLQLQQQPQQQQHHLQQQQQQQILQQQQQHPHPQAPAHHPLGPQQPQQLQQQQKLQQDLRQDPSAQDLGGPRPNGAGPFPPTPIITNQSNAAAMAANIQMLKQQLPTPAMTTAPLPSAAAGTSQNGIAVLKLMQFSDRLTPESEPTDINVWNKFVDEFFSPGGVFKLTLLNTESQLKRQHTIGRPCIARIFQTQYLCGVTSMQLTLDQTNIFLMPNAIMLECPRSSFIYRYSNGSLVVLSGTLTVDLMTDTRGGGLKIDRFNFECSVHEEFVSRQYIKTAPVPPAPATISKKKSKAAAKKSGPNAVPPTHMLPDSAITPWGIPARIVHLLEISDTAYSFADIPFYSIIADLSANLAMCLRTRILEEQVTKGAMGQANRQAINPGAAPVVYRAGQMAGTLNNQPVMHPYVSNPAAAELWKRTSHNPVSPYPVTESAYAAAAAASVSPYTHNVASSLVSSSPAIQNKRKIVEEETMADGSPAKNARKLQGAA